MLSKLIREQRNLLASSWFASQWLLVLLIWEPLDSLSFFYHVHLTFRDCLKNQVGTFQGHYRYHCGKSGNGQCLHVCVAIVSFLCYFLQLQISDYHRHVSLFFLYTFLMKFALIKIKN